MAETWQIILAIIATITIVVVIVIAFGFFRPLYAELMGNQLTKEDEQKNQDNFDSFINNINNCLAFSDSDCVCDGLPNYPGSFSIDSKLIITELPNHKTQINLTYEKKTYRSHIFSDTKISGILYTKEEINYRTKKEVDFSKEPPLFKQEGSKKGMLWWSKNLMVVDPFLYKKDDGIYFIIGYEKPKLTQFKKCGGE